ncbi:plexin domain-containing protein 2-like isoform X1 [Montipora foliosa]|uniref:plexin domain-containing protein 2-like isoform X1 n=1 Tax=Montipora foliosa TaxID=591990 RepID=UPI0035F1E49F
MKLWVVFLIFGALLSCFYPGFKALKYQRFSEGQNADAAKKFVDIFHHYRSRRSTNGNETSCNTHQNCTEKINHRYYTSEVIRDGQKYWRDIEGHPNTTVHSGLSDQFLGSQRLLLSFKFLYYGHYLDSVVLTTGGFLYMDVHDTTLMKDVQYVAPLMAYFNPKLHAHSKVLTLDDGKQLTVQWLNVSLHNKTDVGPFNFQCTLHENGTIWFAYKQIPVPVESLPDQSYHPVRVGISDAFVVYYRRRFPPVFFRVFYIYSQVNITKRSVFNGSAAVLHPLPSCVLGDSCAECMRLDQTTNFNCQWCPITNRCSDGADRYRAEWEIRGCSSVSVRNISDERCVAGRPTTTAFTQTRNNIESSSTTTATTALAGTITAVKRQQSQDKGIGAGAIVAIFIVLVLVISVVAWCFYAYRHPTSKSGLFLIDISRRPSELFKGSSFGVGKAGDVAPSDIKAEVL